MCMARTERKVVDQGGAFGCDALLHRAAAAAREERRLRKGEGCDGVPGEGGWGERLGVV